MSGIILQLFRRTRASDRFSPRFSSSPKLRNTNPKLTVEGAFAILGLDVGSSPAECRQAYLNLAKKMHPDSAGSGDFEGGSSTAFQQLLEAYQVASTAASKSQKQQAQEPQSSMDLEEPLIQHRSPQHRQYLETDGSNLGGAVVNGLSPSDRLKQLQTQRFVRGVHASADYRLERLRESMIGGITSENAADLTPVNRQKRSVRSAKKKSINVMERIADELIEEAMRRGEFDNLPGSGQPLPPQPPHNDLFVDRYTHKLTQILANQGYLPDWIQQGKDLRIQWEDAIKRLRDVHRQLDNPQANRLWNKAVSEFNEEAKRINRAIDRYNLMVPALHLQRCHVDPSSAVVEILQSKETNSENNNNDSSSVNEASDDSKHPNKDSGGEQTSEENDKNIWDPRYIGEIMRDFYRELAKAYVSMMRGFKNHR